MDLTLQVTNTIKLEDIRSLMCIGWEGGMTTWCLRIEENSCPTGFSPKDFKPGGSVRSQNKDWGWSYLYPTMTGGSIRCLVDEEDSGIYERAVPYILDLEKIKTALKLMSEKSPKHWADFISDNSDAITGDVFLQYALFGEIIYG